MTVAPEVSTGEPAVAAAWAVPSRRSQALFAAKVVCHRLRRSLADLGSGLRRFTASNDAGFSFVLAESRTPLWSDDRPAERRWQQGKVHNLRRAAAALDRVVIPAGAVFSFWKQIGRASRRRGYTRGRMLQQGCLVPAMGGGLCQLSNALCDVAVQAGCAIVERHPHSRLVPGSAAAFGRDATVAWNYVDLRFRAAVPLQIEARLDPDTLIVRLRGRQILPHSATPPGAEPHAAEPHAAMARTCATCGETACFRHETRGTATAAGRTAFLVDENWPEFQAYVVAAHGPADILGVPIDGARWRLDRYRWDRGGFARVGAATVPALARAAAMRRLPASGVARRAAEQQGAERIAARLARLLTPDVTRVCVAQSLLPWLWRDGHLGGREFAVLMTRPPIAELAARLDRALAAHPERRTLGDFRAPAWLAEAEAEALAHAARVIAPNADIAAMFPGRIVQIAWQMPPGRSPRPATAARRIAFPGPTIARKGAYEVREAARALRLEVVCLGSELEGPDFWRGITVLRGTPDWRDGVAAIVQPALAEERPRHLLAALAAGVPVIATAACGLPAQPGLTIVPADDLAALVAALREVVVPAPPAC